MHNNIEVINLQSLRTSIEKKFKILNNNVNITTNIIELNIKYPI